MSAYEHVELQLASGAGEVVLTAGEAYELLSLIDGIHPEDRRALLTKSSLAHRTSIYRVEMQLAASADEVVLTAAEAYELLEYLDGIPSDVRRALLASPSTPPLDI